jgi:hypothetical protein
MMTESSVEQLTIPFPREIVRVFRELERIDAESKKPDARNRPSSDTVEWAMEVLLRVVPSTFLIGSEINAFECEIHVSWENDATGKSVVAFLRKRDELKVYYEQTTGGNLVDHKVITGDVDDLSERLRWFFGSANE